MKKIGYFVIASALTLAFVSCGHKDKSRQERIEEFRSELTSADTTAMLKLADEAMEQLKAKKIDQVLASLYEYDDSTQAVTSLSENVSKVYKHRFETFPVLDYARTHYTFLLEGCNDVEYEVTFATAEQTGTGKPAITKFMFNPVKIDGEWKLCLKTPSDSIASGEQL